jgi:hypothetical protein
MAKRNQKREPGTPNPETSNPQPEAPSYADKLREEISELRAQVERMDKVQTLIRSTMTSAGLNHEQKLGQIVDGLYDLGLKDEEVSYVMETKPGRNGGEYMGYTWDEQNKVKSTLKSRQAQLTHLEGRGHHQAAEDSRRAARGDEAAPPLG